MAQSPPAAPILPITRRTPFDPPAELGSFRDEQPVSRLTFADGHVGWLVTGYTEARSVLADSRFSNRQELRRSAVRTSFDGEQPPPAIPGDFLHSDPPYHTRLRRLLTGQFTVRRMNALAPRIAQIVADHLDAMAAAGPPVDLVPSFALPIPSLVICELLGVPYSDREQFQRQTATMMNLNTSKEQAMAALSEIMEYMRSLVVAKRAEPADDLLSGLAGGGELTDEELTGVGLLLLLAGHETTANMLGLGTYALLRHPEQAAALRADPSLVDNAVEELLRYLTIIQFGVIRTALEDVDLDGHLIREGDSVVVSLPAANRDPERFRGPERLDITSPAMGHLAFGHGIHQCLGQQLARIEMRVGYAALFRRFPTLRLAVPPDEVPMRTDMGIYGVHRLPVEW